MKLHLPHALRTALLGVLAFSSYSALGITPDNIVFENKSGKDGGAILNEEGEHISVSDPKHGQTFLFSGNSVSRWGGAVYNSGKMDFGQYASITLENNSSNTSGGAVYNKGTLDLADNSAVAFSGNLISVSHPSVSDYIVYYYSDGGAICNTGTVNISGNGDVSFSYNRADILPTFVPENTNALISRGGAIYNSQTLTFENNSTISFTGNSAYSYNPCPPEESGDEEGTDEFDEEEKPEDRFYVYCETYGGAIHNTGKQTFTNNGDISFSSNYTSASAASYGGAIYSTGTLIFESNGDISFSGNSAYSEGGWAHGGAIYCQGTLTFSNNGDISFSDNFATDSVFYSSSDGGAIYIGSSSTKLTFENNGDISFSGNGAIRHGGAICNAYNGTLAFSGNKSVSFSNNALDPGNDNVAYGGAIYDSRYGCISFSGNEDVSFTGNTAERGGAIEIEYGGTLTFENNTNVSFHGNSATDSHAYGGAIDGDSSFSGNGNISFSNNYADSLGGAICGSTTFSGNGGISFSGNTSALYGGAIYGSTTFCGNGDISFTNNTAGDYLGGAIYIYYSTYTLTFAGNGDVSFQGNFETNSRRLRGLSSGIGTVNLSATTGKSITFYDSVYTSARTTLELNKAYEDAKGDTVEATGSIVFTGKNTEADLAAAFERCGLTDAPTAAQILASRTSEFGKAATLHAGSLEVRDDAVLTAAGITVQTSAATRGGTRVLLHNGTLNSDTVFESGTSLQLAGANSMTGTITLTDGAGLVFDLASATETPMLTLTGTLVQGGALTITIKGAENKEFVLLTGDTAFDASNWDAGHVTVKGASFKDLLWQGNSLVFSITSTPFDDVILDGGEKEIAAGETITPGKLDITGGNDSVIKGGGSITGAGGLDKTGSGKLTISTENPDWAGAINISGGMVIAGTDTALGSGKVSLNGGDLDMGGHAVGNDVTVNANAAIKGGSKFKGNLTLTKGTLSGDKINLASGKTATLKSGTVNNVLAGSGKVVKDTTGTVTLNSANTYTGGTTVKAGTLSAKNVKALGTGTVTLTGGTLHLNSLAVANTVNVNGTASLKGGTKYAGNLTLTKGTLSGDKINLASGKTATLKSGTSNNVLAGAGKVVKDTAGTVTLNGANTYTGGTTVKAGTLSAKNVKALGTGTVSLTGGTLHLNSLALSNTINSSGTASIKGGTKYAGNLTLTKGTLTGDKINLASGKTATLKAGTVKNVLAGAGKVVKDTTGTVTLYGANTYKGGTTLKAGTLSAKNVKALGTGAVTVSGGTLHLNSAAMTNDINVNGTSATIKGGTKYKGKLTLTKGTLSGDKINLTSSKNAYLKAGTVKNALGGNGHVYKQGTGTVTLSGTNNWTGNTYVQGGSLVITGATTLRGTTRTYTGSKLDVRKAVTMGNLYLGGGTLALKPGNMLTVTGTLTLANATKLALSGVTASNSILIKYGKLSNTSKKSLAQFFGLSSAYTVTNKGGKLTIAKAGSKKGTAETLDVSPNALGQSTWGTARAARLFDHTVRDHAQAQSVALDKNRSVWFAAMSGFSHVDDAADINIYGGVVGMQFNGSLGGNAGLAIGQTFGRISPAGATRVQQQTQHAALYGTKMLYTSATDSVSLTGTASYGTTDADHEGYGWTQHSAVLGVRGTWEHKVNQSTAVYGFAGLEYLATDAECGSGSVQALQGSIGAGISHTEGRLTVHADASFTPDMVRNAPTTTVSTGRLGFEVGAGATYRLTDQWSVNAGYTYHNEKRADSHEAYIGARCTF